MKNILQLCLFQTFFGNVLKPFDIHGVGQKVAIRRDASDISMQKVDTEILIFPLRVNSFKQPKTRIKELVYVWIPFFCCLHGFV